MSAASGTYLEVSVSGGTYEVDRSHEGELEKAYRAWKIDQRNTVLQLTLVAGDYVLLAASEINDISLSSESGRANALERAVDARRRRRDAFGPLLWDE